MVFRGGRRRPDTVLVWGMRRRGLRPALLPLLVLLQLRGRRPLVANAAAGTVDGLVGGRAAAAGGLGLVDVRVAAGGTDQVRVVVDVAGMSMKL